MASHRRSQQPSTPLQTTREDSVTPTDYKPSSSPSKMCSIESLLNPTVPSETQLANNGSPMPNTPSPALTNATSLQSGNPGTPTSVRGKRAVKDNFVFNRGPPTGNANYLPFEFSDEAICLSKSDRKELPRQHRLFRIKPSEEDGEGQIRNFTRYIPYSSDKKNFFHKTGKDGFNVFQYTFRNPDDPGQTEYTVMWDYGNGLTRITPFFKACNHSKTVPAKALTTNPGLKDLSHSITGGALAAQGYWVPYACARAICLTFCYHIRWALTPIFGPSFIRECLPPNHAGYQHFKINPETVRCATLEAEGWKQASAHANSPADIPRSVPQNTAAAGGKELRPRDNRPVLKGGSPFASDTDTGVGSDYDDAEQTAIDSPRISPKTPAPEPFQAPGWTSINGSQRATAVSQKYAITNPLSHSLLNQPHQYASWRAADPVGSTAAVTDRRASLRSHQGRKTVKRRCSSLDEAEPADADYNDYASDASGSSSENDDADIVVPPKKRLHRLAPKDDGSTALASLSATNTPQPTRSVLFGAADFRAAQALINLSQSN